MNLIEDAWLPVLREQGPDKIAPWQMVEPYNPVLEIIAPRPDFQGALYQFLIGLLQTCFTPEDHDEWLEYWEEMPTVEELKKTFEKVASAFELDKPVDSSFLQDFDLKAGEIKNIAGLLIESPGGKTIKDNLDHFVKGGAIRRVCPSCVATALFTLQINAPSGGVGHRVGLRGGGPLTTLVMPGAKESLWKKLWLNVLDRDWFETTDIELGPGIFPWMGPTRISDKGGKNTTPEDVDSLQVYWGMPRRIRLDFLDAEESRCDLCGENATSFVEKYRTQNYGTNYEGAWVHPLTPYRFDPKKEKPPLSLKGQQGGLGYRHWLGVTMTDQSSGDCSAKVVKAYMEERVHSLTGESLARLWCFGYDMDNMKARCWYDHEMPLLKLDAAQRDNLLHWVKELVDAATDVSGFLRSQLKEAWFKRAKDVKGDMNAVVLEFWQQSENDFYALLKRFSDLPGDQRQVPPEIYAFWAKTIRNLALDLFDSWALESPVEDADMKRIIGARKELAKKLRTSKAMKTLLNKSSL
ncbi:CRISPR processing complex protein CasA [Syntrophotalea carbinolica DSM 2380]|uniref:CRISPR processing complex protein CasA n=1 Tax=Syntrophotalea carbinolica (strain DSM 2380 / NBRC 103641 / GraBd1) TaxID=338963 RepID=Q3A5Z7_SYNC1|nr:type I-E CRISPR-associated protein Cse1/CasA [Syntrophotalea carbinolica]ABA88210.1 CRISPR processing complex protein CasA [Syntrophotalea carbinolica DSM 2380]